MRPAPFQCAPTIRYLPDRMRFLKQLNVQGYKTFASRTEFLFDRGVTAVIGPNGSGKSNLADALRWVLGEQSYGTLRARRTEDMIFTGSEQRARLGMASVTLVLDNSTAWLPTPFSEVEITRRAYRSGDNEYYLNGTRVRLREIAELLGSSGLSERTYTVIGQGMVDQALSQRPEERRRLFEEAAGITVHQSKREQALRQMEDARTNLTRAADIVAEITPRMRYLKGQARRAQEYQQVKADLDAQLRVWYAYRWRMTREGLTSAGERMAQTQAASEAELARMNDVISGMAAARTERSALREQLGEWHRESSGLHRLAEAAQRELAVRGEQARLFGEQAAELRGDLGSLQAALDDGAERMAEAQARLQEAEQGHGDASARVAAARAALQERERERSGVNALAAEAERAALSLKSQLADRQARLTHAEERRTGLQQQRERQQQEAAAAAVQVARLAAALRKAEESIAAVAAEAGQLDQERRTQAAALAAAQARERAAREQLGAAQRVLHRLQDQREMLERLRDEGAGLAAGPRNVMAAREKLHGILGTLGDLIETPAELERAIEAALGGRLQDIVVGSWADAEAAVAFLKRDQGGRATFLPLDSLRPSQAVQPPRMPGVLGLASELVRFPADIRPAVEHALNRTIVVQDLPAARKVLGRDGHGTLVTLEGDIVRPGGSVTGGSENSRRDGGVLSRARTLRELPGQIEAAGAEVKRWESEMKAAREEQAGFETELARLNARARAGAGAGPGDGGARPHARAARERPEKRVVAAGAGTAAAAGNRGPRRADRRAPGWGRGDLGAARGGGS